MALPLSLPLLALMAGGSILGAAGTSMQGEAAAEAAERNAQFTELSGRQRESAIRRQGRRDLGRIRTAIGKAGVTTEGSPMEVLAESAAAIEMDALNARFGTRVSAASQRAEGRGRRRAAQIGSAAQLLSGGAQVGLAGRQLGVF